MTLEEIREFFAQDLYATEQSGIVIEDARQGYAKCRMPLERRHKNAVGGVMGGAIFTLADFTFAVASNVESVPTVSLSAQITYLNAPRGDALIAESERLHTGKSTCAFRIAITDDRGNAVASVTFSGFKLNR